MRYLQEYWDDISNVTENIPNLEILFGKSILITGATGMICSTIIDVLAWLNKKHEANIHLILAGRNKEKIAIRFQNVISIHDYEFLEYDATRDENIQLKIDYIIHGASNANPAIYDKEPVETLIGNIVGLRNLLELAKDCPGSRLLYISSSEVYGNRSDFSKNIFSEEDYGYIDILKPRACYPNGKRAAETLCLCYKQEYDVDSVIVRPGHIYGPSITKSDTRASASFTRDALNGKDIVMKSSGSQLRSYCYTLDCASAILTVLINGISANAYNISNKNSVVSIRQVAETLANVANVNVVYEKPSDAECRSYNMMNSSVLNAQKLEALGWRAMFSIEQGLQRTIQFGGD